MRISKQVFGQFFGMASALIFSITSVMADDTTKPAENAAITLASEYLKAYSTFDVTKMEPFYSDDAVFHDPTSTTQNASGGPFLFEGKQAIIKGLGDYAGQYKNFTLNYDVERRYESKGIVVFVATLKYIVEAEDGQKFEGTAPIVTVISTKDGKVTRHMDYYDYKGNAVNFPK